MITEDYVSFEVAKLLKEKGFSENTICKYVDVGGATEKWYDDYRERVLHYDLKEGYLIEPLIEPRDQYEIIGNTISAPTHQMVLKWLREVHNLYINVFVTWKNKIPHYQWSIDNLTTQDTTYDTPCLEKYEQACEAAIKYCLENLI